MASTFVELIRMPSFYAAYITSICVLLGYVFWIVIDASFHEPVELALIDLRVQPHPGMDLWQFHGGRFLLFVIMALVAFVSITIVLTRLFFGSAGGRSIAAMLLATALLSGWLTLFVGYSRLADWSFQFRLKRQLPEFESAVAILAENWPNQDGTLPEFGNYSYDPEYPNLLVVESAHGGSPIKEGLGILIRRISGSGVAFDLSSRPSYRLEFHTKDEKPKSHEDIFDTFTIQYYLVESIPFGNNIYLTNYDENSEGLFDESIFENDMPSK